jgi:hypothetical protein
MRTGAIAEYTVLIAVRGKIDHNCQRGTQLPLFAHKIGIDQPEGPDGPVPGKLFLPQVE